MRFGDYFKAGLRYGLERTALADEETALTFAEVDDRSRDIASALARCGIGAGRRAAVYSPNSAAGFLCVFGICRSGAAWVPVSARNTSDINTRFLALVECDFLFYHSAFEADIDAILSGAPTIRRAVCIDRRGGGGRPSLDEFAALSDGREPEVPDDPDRIVVIPATGGTTGLAKAAMQSQRTWDCAIATVSAIMPADEPPVHLCAAPMTHGAGVFGLMMMPQGTTHVFLRKSDPVDIMEAIAKYRVTHLFLPPTVIYMMLAHPRVRDYDYSSLKYFLVAGAPIAPEKLREAMDVFGPVMCQSFGQAEAPMFLTFLSAGDLLGADLARKPDLYASCGRATPGVRLEIAGGDGAFLEPYEKGEIVARSDLVFSGYYRNPEGSGEVLKDGWLHTGDIGFRDESGFFYINDRKKDMIVTGGFNVYSAEIEQVLLSHPAIRECAVIGVPDEKWGEAVKAVVELKCNASVGAPELIALVKAQLGGVFAPKTIEFVAELPRSPNGKVLKADIRRSYWSGRDRLVS